MIFGFFWDYIENPGFHINKINILPTPNRQNRLFIAGKCGTWVNGITGQFSPFIEQVVEFPINGIIIGTLLEDSDVIGGVYRTFVRVGFDAICLQTV